MNELFQCHLVLLTLNEYTFFSYMHTAITNRFSISIQRLPLIFIIIFNNFLVYFCLSFYFSSSYSLYRRKVSEKVKSSSTIKSSKTEFQKKIENCEKCRIQKFNVIISNFIHNLILRARFLYAHLQCLRFTALKKQLNEKKNKKRFLLETIVSHQHL